jgi:hypothetical protein
LQPIEIEKNIYSVDATPSDCVHLALSGFLDESFDLLVTGKVKRANRLVSIIDEIWVIHLQKVDTLLMIGI